MDVFYQLHEIAGLSIISGRSAYPNKEEDKILLVLAKKKPVRVCIRSLYLEYPPLKPKIEKPEKLLVLVLVRPFFPN